MRTVSDTTLARLLLIGTVGILLLIPFHATTTVWLASLGFDYTLVRLWKEFLLLGLAVVTGGLLATSKSLRSRLAESKTVRVLAILIGLYGVLHLVLGAYALWQQDVTTVALGYALLSNGRMLGIFLIALVVGTYYRDWLSQHWQQLIIWPALVVIGFGLLQEFVLPYDFLKYLGYGAGTIEPYIAVDQKVEYARLQSTLRGPNPLGAYLVIVLTTLVAVFMVRKKGYIKIGLAFLAGLLVLYGTYSRSAWIGLAAAGAVLIWGLVQSRKARHGLLLAGAGMVLVGGMAVWALQDNDRVQNVLFHTDENSAASTSSNEQRAGAIMGGLEDMAREPWGRGPGTAGPASVYNNSETRISENYFIQLGQEVGVVGLGLFVAITVVLGVALWRVGGPESLGPLVLVASLVGLTMVNMLSHAWADDTLAYVWWGMAGLLSGRHLVKTREMRENS